MEKQDWLDYFEAVNGRSPEPNEIEAAKKAGEFVEENSSEIKEQVSQEVNNTEIKKQVSQEKTSSEPEELQIQETKISDTEKPLSQMENNYSTDQ